MELNVRAVVGNRHDVDHTPTTQACGAHGDVAGELPVQAPAVPARCERTAVQRSRARFVKRRDLRLAMPIPLVGVRRGRAIGWLCKSEAAGSNPARSISRKSSFAAAFLRSVPDLATAVRARCERTGDCCRAQSSEVGSGPLSTVVGWRQET